MPNATPAPVDAAAEREHAIIRTSNIGIAGNLVLAAFKVTVGTLSNSIAIVLDAVNNLSDALSSLITIVGTKLSRIPADRKHPYGYGRVEYLSALIIAVIVLSAGLTSLKESISATIHPETPSYTPVGLAIVAVAVVVKLVLGRYVKSVGERVNSGSLVASGTDATNDAIISATTLIAAAIYLRYGILLEGVLGTIISIVIVKAGVEMIKETLSKVLGERVDADLARTVREAALSVDGIRGVYDLSLNDYGPDRYSGTLHVEVDERLSAREVDSLCHRVQQVVAERGGVLITSVGIYATDVTGETTTMRERVQELVFSHEHVLQMHGFYADEEARAVRFDVVISFDDPNRAATHDAIVQECQATFPDYEFFVVLDVDVADL